jgi:hypothetical protein
MANPSTSIDLTAITPDPPILSATCAQLKGFLDGSIGTLSTPEECVLAITSAAGIDVQIQCGCSTIGT